MIVLEREIFMIEEKVSRVFLVTRNRLFFSVFTCGAFFSLEVSHSLE